MQGAPCMGSGLQPCHLVPSLGEAVGLAGVKKLAYLVRANNLNKIPLRVLIPFGLDTEKVINQ